MRFVVILCCHSLIKCVEKNNDRITYFALRYSFYTSCMTSSLKFQLNSCCLLNMLQLSRVQDVYMLIYRLTVTTIIIHNHHAMVYSHDVPIVGLVLYSYDLRLGICLYFTLASLIFDRSGPFDDTRGRGREISHCHRKRSSS